MQSEGRPADGALDFTGYSACASRSRIDGVIVHTRLYWMYALLEGDDVDIFTDGLANWQPMSSGEYPSSRGMKRCGQ